MKNVQINRIVMMLTLTALVAQSVGIFAMNEDTPAPSFANRVRQTGRQVRQRAGDAIDGVIVSAHNLANDLQQYKQCRGTQEGCPPALMQRIKKAGAVISVGAGAVLIAGAGITAAVAGTRAYGKHKKGKFTKMLQSDDWDSIIAELQKKYKFNDRIESNNFLIYAAFTGDVSDMDQFIPLAEKRAFKAAIEVATIRYPEKTGVSGYLINEYKKKFKK